MSDIKDTFTQDELLQLILKDDPNFDPKEYESPSNVVSMALPPDPTKYVPLTFNQLENEIPSALQYVFYPCLPVQGIGFVYAKTGLGKTLFTLNLAYAIARGGNFLKYSCPKPRKVLYIDGEMSYTQIHNRIMQMAKQQGDLDFKENFNLLTPDKLLPFRLPMIDDQNGQEIYTKIFEMYNIEVIIFDNLSMLSCFDENKAHEWKKIQDWLLHLRALGKTVIIVHHAGKNDDYRGTSRMLDCADVAIGLQPINSDDLENEAIKGKKFKIIYRKSREFGGKDALSYEVNFENGFWTCKSIEQTELDRVIDMVSMKMSTRSIATDLGCSQTKVCKLVRKAKDLRLIRD